MLSYICQWPNWTCMILANLSSDAFHITVFFFKWIHISERYILTEINVAVVMGIRIMEKRDLELIAILLCHDSPRNTLVYILWRLQYRMKRGSCGVWTYPCYTYEVAFKYLRVVSYFTMVDSKKTRWCDGCRLVYDKPTRKCAAWIEFIFNFKN